MENATVIDSTAVPVRNITLLGVLRIPAVRQIILLVGIATAVAGGFGIYIWSQAPGFTALYADLPPAEAAQVAEALNASGIPHKVDSNSGSIMVPREMLHDARLQLAGQGLPAGVSAGMDMMQEQNSFGVSQFMEGARYQYALEAELARTISHLGAVRDARVHLALPKSSAFVRQEKAASASVLLTLYRGRNLEAGQASSIVHLVASSVPNLETGNVTLIDQHGQLLSSMSDEWNDGQTLQQFKHTERIENEYKRRIVELLTPIVGPGRVRAEVVASMDFTIVEETREAFDPTSTVVRSEQVNEEQRRSGSSGAEGIPGAVSNQPPTAAAANGETQGAEEGLTEPVDSSRSATRNYEVDRTISRTRPQSGTIQKLSVAVLIDDSPTDSAAAVAAADGETGAAGSTEPSQSTSLPIPVDIEKLTSLVREAVGIDEARGDTVAVVAAPFRSAPVAVAEEAPAIWERPQIQDAARQGAGFLLVLALAFGVVRPMLKNLISSNMTSSAQYIAAGDANFAVPASAGTQGGAGAVPIPPPSYDEKVAAAKNISGHDPARVAQVVKKWVAADV